MPKDSSKKDVRGKKVYGKIETIQRQDFFK